MKSLFLARLVPFPILSLGLLALWLLLNQSVNTGHILLGSIVAIGGGLAFAALHPPKARIRRLRPAVRLTGLVLVDIIRSNVAVTKIILQRGVGRRRTSGFLSIPLDLQDRYGLAILAAIITSTPGTLWVDFNSAKSILTLHVLDLIDEEIWVDTIKRRYERLLMEIFE